MNAMRWCPCSIRCVTASVPPLDVVDANAAPAVASTPVDEHDRDAATRQRLQLRCVLIDGRDEDSPHPLLGEKGQVVPLTRGIAVAVAEVDRHSGISCDLFDALGDIREEGVRCVEDEIRDRPAAACAKLATRFVADEAEIVDRAQHLAPRRLADRLGTVEHVRDGADGHPGAPGDVLDSRRR